MVGGCTLLEPYYQFRLTVPSESVGRAMSELQLRAASFEVENADEEFTVLCGKAPVSELHGYAREVAAYTRGQGSLSCRFDGYAPCHNEKEIVEKAAYDPTADLENTPHSVFCAHGSGFVVPWNEVELYKHLDADEALKPASESIIPRAATLSKRYDLSDEELEAIMLREFGPIKRRRYSEPHVNAAKQNKKPSKKSLAPRRRLLLVDGYNLIYAWEVLKEIADYSLEKARESLMDILSNYVAFTKTELILVFDAYLVKDGMGSDFWHDGYRVVFTKENQTADAFIEGLMHEMGPDYSIHMVSGDRLLQFSAVHSGILRMTANEFVSELTAVGNEITEFLNRLQENKI